MALLRTRGGGLLATGPDAVRANAMRQQQMALQAAAAPRVISAPRPILEENPLNTIGTGLASLGKSLTATAGIRREQAARQALGAAGNDMNRLMEVARRFPATNAGKAAGLQVKNAFDMRATTSQLNIDLLRSKQQPKPRHNQRNSTPRQSCLDLAAKISTLCRRRNSTKRRWRRVC